jgi:hypothetical protein
MDFIIKGEKIQQLCDIYLGLLCDFEYNPLIKLQKEKQLDIHSINCNYNNPRIIFCYSHRINLLVSKLIYFQNEFILVSHNSDENIENNNITNQILNCNKLIKWYSQNACFKNIKLIPIPIGIANNMWNHGNITYYNDLGLPNIIKLNLKKTSKIYFNFDINTNFYKRNLCYHSLKEKIDFLNPLPIYENLDRLSKYEFCICPEGNGVDTHRLWEAIYLQCVPIVIRSTFIDIIIDHFSPYIVILNSWDDIDISTLNYSQYIFDKNYCDKIYKNYSLLIN